MTGLLTQEELKQKYNTAKVGQVWKAIESNQIVLVAMVRDKELTGYIFDGFQVAPFVTLAVLDFARYYDCIYDPHKKGYKYAV